MTGARVLLLSPYHGGSHAAWAEGYRRHSSHRVELSTLPARFWKWRMHGGAVTLARRFLRDGGTAEVVVATDMLDLSTFLALTRARTSTTPAVLFMHENQLTYPLPADGSSGPMRRQGGERDLHYAFVNVASMLAADRILFNSQYHRDAVLAELPRFLRRFPDRIDGGAVADIDARSEVVHVGIDAVELGAVEPLPPRPSAPASARSATVSKGAGDPPLVLWSQRWEYDKNPAELFDALRAVRDDGIGFRLALCGQSFGRRPAEFDAALDDLGDRIVHVGFASREVYRELLHAAEVTVSTAHHEFFGIAVVEAVRCATFPILPRRLSYPELIPDEYHGQCLYGSPSSLVRRLRWALTARGEAARLARRLAVAVSRFDWERVAPRTDEAIEATLRGPRDDARTANAPPRRA